MSYVSINVPDVYECVQNGACVVMGYPVAPVLGQAGRRVAAGTRVHGTFVVGEDEGGLLLSVYRKCWW